MRRDVTEIARFYASPLGETAARLIGAKLNDAWGSTDGQDVLGVGFATPWLESMTEARRAIAAMLEGQGVQPWPSARRCRAALIEEENLPFPTGLFDRVLAIHALEEAANPLALVREMGRVLAPSGRLVLAVAGRGGLWAHAENTPFGHGRPYTRGQLEALVRQAELEPFAWSQTLHVPPWTPMARFADLAEGIGGRLLPGAGGVLLLEAIKTTYALRPRAVERRKRARAPGALAPQPAAMSPPAPIRSWTAGTNTAKAKPCGN